MGVRGCLAQKKGLRGSRYLSTLGEPPTRINSDHKEHKGNHSKVPLHCLKTAI